MLLASDFVRVTPFVSTYACFLSNLHKFFIVHAWHSVASVHTNYNNCKILLIKQWMWEVPWAFFSVDVWTTSISILFYNYTEIIFGLIFQKKKNRKWLWLETYEVNNPHGHTKTYTLGKKHTFLCDGTCCLKELIKSQQPWEQVQYNFMGNVK